MLLPGSPGAVPARLTDFGIAFLAGDPSLTRSGTILGSPGYIAPERLRDEPTGPAADLWSLGATLFAAVEGHGPFDRETPMAALAAVLTEQAPRARRAGALAPVLSGLLASDPASRLSAEQAEAALRRVAAGLPTGLPEPPRAGRVASTARRRHLLLGGVAAAVVVLLVAVAALVLPLGASSGGRPSESALATPPSRGASRPAPSAQSAAIAHYCALLSDDQVAQLVPGPVKDDASGSDQPGCEWAAKSTHHAVAVDRLDTPVASATSATSATSAASAAEAHALFLSRRNTTSATSGTQDAWGDTDVGVTVVHGRSTGVTDAPGIGDEAFEYGVTGDPQKYVVVVRVGTVLLEVSFITPGSVPRQQARTAAKWAAAAVAAGKGRA